MNVLLKHGKQFAAYGWVQNISSDLMSAQPQQNITAVEGETVTLSLFFTKNKQPNSILYDFSINTTGSAIGK